VNRLHTHLRLSADSLPAPIPTAASRLQSLGLLGTLLGPIPWAGATGKIPRRGDVLERHQGQFIPSERYSPVINVISARSNNIDPQIRSPIYGLLSRPLEKPYFGAAELRIPVDLDFQNSPDTHTALQHHLARCLCFSSPGDDRGRLPIQGATMDL
jgi:hypothetical protein